MALRDLQPGPVCLDTSVFLYFIQEHPRYLSLVEPLFEQIDRGRRHAVTSVLTLLEVLVVPYRVGDQALAQRYEEILSNTPNLDLVPIDARLLRATALLRARVRMRTPDAIQVATALGAGCRTLITNDREIPAVPGLEVLCLDDLR